MKNIKLIKITAAMLFTASLSQAATVTVQNINGANDAAYGLFNEGGTLIDGDTAGNVRIGYFGAVDTAALWAAGDVAGLDAAFTSFGADFGMFGGGLDGAFQGGPSATSTPFAGQTIVLWATDGGAFDSDGSEHLIASFDALTFQSEVWTGGQVLLGTDAATLIAGEFGNYSNDFNFGGGSVGGFNTAAAVPEPSTFAALAGFLALGCVALRRRK